MHFAKATCLATVILLVILAQSAVEGRQAIDPGHRWLQAFQAAPPVYRIASHQIGKISLAVANNGTLGTEYHPGAPLDAFTGELIYSLRFPEETPVSYLYGAALWVGAVREDTVIRVDSLFPGDILPNGDTVAVEDTVVFIDTTVVDKHVSEGHDGWNRRANELLPGTLTKRSTTDSTDADLYPGAVSHLDYVAVYTDTLSDAALQDADYFDSLPHLPLNIEVSQKSFSWGYTLVEDFVLVDYSITNLDTIALSEVYVGLFVDGDVCYDCMVGSKDDLSGYIDALPSVVSPPECGFFDTINLAWIADNDGDLDRVPREQAPHVAGVSVIQYPDTGSATISYNWWLSAIDTAQDWGPRRIIDTVDPGTGRYGTPEGDVNKYHYLSNGEFDYDQAYTATILGTDPEWQLPPSELSGGWAVGGDTRFLLSFGPFALDPAQTMSLTLAFVAGENLHSDPANIDNLPDDPDAYYAGLDFSDLAKNAVWAGWVYDNPGIDTDNDGYFGEMQICASSGETFWYKGDGVPDYNVPTAFASGMVYGLRPDSVMCAVYDSPTQMWRQPVSDYKVHVYSSDGSTIFATAVTDSCGAYEIEMPLNSSFCLGVDQAHCVYPMQTTMSTTDTANLDIELSSIWYSGMVYELRNFSFDPCAILHSDSVRWRVPMADYEVGLYSSGGDTLLSTVSTDSCSGMYRIEVPLDGDYCLGVTGATCLYPVHPPLNSGGNIDLDIRVTSIQASGMVYELQPDSADTCDIYDPVALMWRQPVSGYRVHRFSGDGETVLATAITNSCGLYTLDVPMSADFCVGIGGGDHCQYTLYPIPNDSDTSGLDIEVTTIMASGMVYGLQPDSTDTCDVYDSGDQLWRRPVSGYRMNLYSANGDTLLKTVLTDSCGRYSIEVAAPGAFCIGPNEDHCRYSLSPTLGSADTAGLDYRVPIVLASGMVYSLRPDSTDTCDVYDALAQMWRQPAPDREVSLYNSDGGTILASVMTNSCGLYSLEVPIPGDFCIGVEGATCMHAVSTALSSADTTDLDISISPIQASGMVYDLQPDSTDTCDVYDSDAQMWRHPVPDYEVNLYSPDGGQVLATALSDSCGLYSFDVPLLADFCLGVDFAHCLYQLHTTMSSNDTTGLDIRVASIQASGVVFRFGIDSIPCAVYDSSVQMWRQPISNIYVSIFASDSTTLMSTTRSDACGAYSLAIPILADVCLGVNSEPCVYSLQTTMSSTDMVGLNIDLTVTETPTDVDEEASDLPFSFNLAQNYPNPFNPATMISYTLATRSLVKLSVFNMLGQKVATLVNEVLPAGEHQAEWDGTNQTGKRVASGIYFYRLEAGNHSVVKKMVLLK